jgi:hypothetical protein
MSGKSRFSLAERLAAKSEPQENGCVIFIGAKTRGGYGQIGTAGGKPRRAHRIAWELVNGPIPAGMQLDHLCRNRACVNVAHLEIVTNRENSLRGAHPKVALYWANRCQAGHEFTPENTYVAPDRTTRQCKACRREKVRLYRARKKEAR